MPSGQAAPVLQHRLPFRVARRTVTSLRAAFAALPSCLRRAPARSIA
ncbi:hypothetical protein C7S15_5961 [Burkholderia cepacia]|nr:hypothetical protein [Burkholderia cepacia]